MASFAGLQIPFASVPSVWKDSEGINFDRAKLEEVFPGARTARSARNGLWSSLDYNGNSFVSLAEFDSWFNQHTISVEGAVGASAVDGKSALYAYSRPCLIRAFNLANGVSGKTHSSVPAGSADDYVTKDEFRCLMVATQTALVINRIFDIADTSDDRRVSQAEWNAQLSTINAELAAFGYAGGAVTEGDFGKVDADGGGMVLLDEAVWFFLGALTSDPTLLAENREEGC